MQRIAVKFWEILNSENTVEEFCEHNQIVQEKFKYPKGLKDYVFRAIWRFLNDKDIDFSDKVHSWIEYEEIDRVVNYTTINKKKIVQGLYLPVTSSELGRFLDGHRDQLFYSTLTSYPLLQALPMDASPDSIIRSFSLQARDFYLDYHVTPEFRVGKDIYHKIKHLDGEHPFKIEYYESLKPNYIYCVVNED